VHIDLAFEGDVPMTMTVKRLSIPLVSPILLCLWSFFSDHGVSLAQTRR